MYWENEIVLKNNLSTRVNGKMIDKMVMVV